MRQLFLDTETTGLDPASGHRIVEIAVVEVSNRHVTDCHFHFYLDPERDSDEGALKVHGLSREFLRGKPKFREICNDFLEFITDADVFIHNAPFDVGFINRELELINCQPLQHYCKKISDTLVMAKELHPGKRNNLDALCERYYIDHTRRTLHGALLDAELLAEVYLAMTRGQKSLLIALEPPAQRIEDEMTSIADLTLPVRQADGNELELHNQLMLQINKASGGNGLW